MKVFVACAALLALSLAACRHHRDGRDANDLRSSPVYDAADAGPEGAEPGLPEGHPRLAPPAPSVTAQPGDVQL